jgi:hypothetical protein
MKRNREFEQQARRVAEAAALSRLVAPVVREAMSDRKVRLAAGDAYEAGRRMYEEVRGSDPKHVVGRMARDERFQSEVAALVRSATNAVDTGIASGRRRFRRRLIRLLMIGTGAACFIGIALRRRCAEADRPSDADGREVTASEATTATAQTEWITG